MADFERFAGKLLQLEGAYAHPGNEFDFTLKALLCAWLDRVQHDIDVTPESLLNFTEDEAKRVVKEILWDFYSADNIRSECVAEFIAEWAYNSGPMIVALLVQKVLGVVADGIYGPITLAAINESVQEELHEALKQERKNCDKDWPKVELLRTYQEEQTIGELHIDGVEFCKTLELKWLNNKRSRSCIPEGIYKVVKRLAHEKRKYNHFHVTNVVNRSYILIHTGNYSSQILGCILLGDKFVDMNKDGLLDVCNSTATLERLYEKMPDEFDLTIREKETPHPAEAEMRIAA